MYRLRFSPARLPALVSALALGAALAACGSPEPEPISTETGAATVAAPQRPMAGGLSLQAIEQAVFAPPQVQTQPGQDPNAGTPPQAQPAPDMPRADLIRAQILLDRSPWSPGAIDGLDGVAMKQAIKAFQTASGVTATGELDAETFGKLTASDDRPVLTGYQITAQDVAGPFIGALPETTEAKAQLPALGFATAREALAEKFHITEALLEALNPGVDFARAGQTIVVPAIATTPLSAEVARIEVRKADGTVAAFDASNRLLAVYPATIGSDERPAPSGDLKVVGVANEPDYTYDPTRLTYGDGKEKLVVAAGPNNPVGTVWIDLSRDTYGIHGTPEPHEIGKTASNGCVRLTNWDAEQLAAAVKPGVDVKFI
nr:L,D-transpeptidase catalytic domain [uncultured organism]